MKTLIALFLPLAFLGSAIVFASTPIKLPAHSHGARNTSGHTIASLQITLGKVNPLR